VELKGSDDGELKGSSQDWRHALATGGFLLLEFILVAKGAGAMRAQPFLRSDPAQSKDEYDKIGAEKQPGKETDAKGEPIHGTPLQS
jgi:hypothetical protein